MIRNVMVLKDDGAQVSMLRRASRDSDQKCCLYVMSGLLPRIRLTPEPQSVIGCYISECGFQTSHPLSSCHLYHLNPVLIPSNPARILNIPCFTRRMSALGE